jgi:phosphotransferase system HPr (HPr) family protein
MGETGFQTELRLVNPHGLHLRPASRFVAVANRFEAEVRVSVDGGEEGNGKSILDLSGRAAEKGATIRIRTMGPDAEDALRALIDLVRNGFDEMG